MSILIKGMKMPKGTNELRLIIHPNGQVIISKQTYWEETEAIEVPAHGRLIDANSLGELCNIMADKCDGIGTSIWEQFRVTVECCPTIIPVDTDINVLGKEEGE